MAAILKGSIALVTGAGGWIGSATVEAMLEAGAEVIATDLRAPEIGTWALAHDVTDEECWQRIAAIIEQRWGRLDVLVNNAGLLRLSTIEDETLASWRQQMAVNADALLSRTKRCCRCSRKRARPRRRCLYHQPLFHCGLIGATFMASYGELWRE